MGSHEFPGSEVSAGVLLPTIVDQNPKLGSQTHNCRTSLQSSHFRLWPLFRRESPGHRLQQIETDTRYESFPLESAAHLSLAQPA